MKQEVQQHVDSFCNGPECKCTSEEDFIITTAKTHFKFAKFFLES